MASSNTFDSSDVASNLITEFTVFPKLPTEMRIKIWKYAADKIEPHTLSLLPKVKGNKLSSPLFPVCQSSRDEALKNGAVVLQSNDGTSPSYGLILDPKIDTLLLNPTTPFTLPLFASYYQNPSGFDHHILFFAGTTVASQIHPVYKVKKAAFWVVDAFESVEDNHLWLFKSNIWHYILERLPKLKEMTFVLTDNPTEALEDTSGHDISQIQNIHVNGNDFWKLDNVERLLINELERLEEILNTDDFLKWDKMKIFFKTFGSST